MYILRIKYLSDRHHIWDAVGVNYAETQVIKEYVHRLLYA